MPIVIVSLCCTAKGYFSNHRIQKALYTASIVLLVDVWGGHRFKVSTSAIAVAKELADIDQCINLLIRYEKRQVLKLETLSNTDIGQ